MAEQSRVAIALRKLCSENDGGSHIDRKLLYRSMAQLHGSVSEAELEEACRHISPDSNEISIEAFVNWVFSPVGRRFSATRFPQLGNHVELPEIAADAKIEYFTDVEGNWEYFLHFVYSSEILSWDGEDAGAFGDGVLVLKDNCYLVFGGDSVDKGTGDIRFVKTMLSLKERYWNRVVIILGNRDLNKLRLLNELSEGADGAVYEERGGPYWLNGKFKRYKDFIDEKKMSQGLVSTLHWMLDVNMGCQKTTFPGRKHELALLQQRCTDLDVVKSFRESVNPNGRDPWMLDFLQVGQIAAVLGDTLFIHAGIKEDSLGYVPGRQDTIRDVRHWVKAINEWKDAQLEDFLQRPDWREENGAWRRGGDLLVDYGGPGGSGVFDESAGTWKRDDRTVVYHVPFDNGNPVLYPDGLEKRLQVNNIRRVFSGHQPHGQSPTVVRHPRTDLLVMTCDTSYSNMNALKIQNAANNRGDVLTAVRIERDKVKFDGVLKDGKPHSVTLSSDSSKDQMPHGLVGRQLKDMSWVKTITEEGLAVCVRGFGFQLFETIMHPHKACFQMKPEFFKQAFHYKLRELKYATQPVVYQTDDLEPGNDPDVPNNNLNSALQNLTQFNRKEFEAAQSYIFDTRGTIWKLEDNENELNTKQVETRVRENINGVLQREGTKCIFTTNDSNLSRRQYLQSMREMGFDIQDIENIITTSYTCAWYIRQCGFKKPFVVCSDRGILYELKELGIGFKATVDMDSGAILPEYTQDVSLEKVTGILDTYGLLDVDAVVIGWDLNMTHMKIAVAAAILQLKQTTDEKKENADGKKQDADRKKVELISCSGDTRGVLGNTPERWQEGEFKSLNNRKILMWGNGSMAKAVAAAASMDENEIVDVGRPGEFFLQLLLDKLKALDVDPTKAVMVGDTLDVDIKMANVMGMRSLLVLSGVTRYEELDKVEDPNLFPTWVITSLAQLELAQ